LQIQFALWSRRLWPQHAEDSLSGTNDAVSASRMLKLVHRVKKLR
jgi:hypothetical protein